MAITRMRTHASLANLADEFATIRSNAGITDGYSQEAFFEAEAGGADKDPGHIRDHRSDLTDIPFVTIDPPGAKDLDQAVAIEDRGDGWLVRYAIADVGAHVVPGGAIDRDSRERVETVYGPDTRIGLHPPALAEGYGSLLAGQRRKAVVWTMAVQGDGTLDNVEIERSWVQSRAQYTYTELSEAPPDEATDLLARMRHLGDARRALAKSRGAVTLPKPSQEVVVRDGLVTLEFQSPLPLEDDNAHISLLTGEAAASVMLDGGSGILRTMPPASKASVRRLRHQAAALGVQWRKSDSYFDVVHSLDHNAPGTPAFLASAIKLFRGARWEAFVDGTEFSRPESLTHGALAVPYAHVTAPLRRLVDRYATEFCLAHAHGREVPQWAREAVPWIGQTMAHGVRVNARAERASVDAIEAAMLQGREGEQFQGVGIDDRTVQIASPAIVARCKGGVEEGEIQTIVLESARPLEGPIFRVATPEAAPSPDSSTQK